MADPLVLAYLAGIIDADGFVTIMRFPRVQGMYHSIRVGISGTRNAPHLLAAETFGGRVYCYPNRNHRPQFQWGRTGADAVVALEALAPHLRVKRPQADLALRLYVHMREHGRSEASIAEREAMRHEMMFDLNEGRSRIKQDSGYRSGTAGPPDLAIQQFPAQALR